jgi:alpha-1,3-rhamnosyl/mannosyltransferase
VSRPLVLLDADVVGRRRTGDESYTLGLLRELPGAAPDLRFACSLRDLAALPDDVPAAVERHRLAVRSPYRRIPWAFPRLARAAGADLVHLHYFVPPRLPGPAVVTVHDLSFARAPELLRRRDRLLFQAFVPGSLRRARRIVAVSEFTRADVCERYGVDPARVVAVHNGVGPAFRPVGGAVDVVRERYDLDVPYVLFVGALQPRKNPLVLLDAFARLVGDGLPHVLALAGRDRGSLGAVRERIARHRLEGRVALLGHVLEPDLPALYTAADALCFPSLYEGFGLPALEAMACGIPVAASRTTGLGEAVGDAAETFDPRSVDEVADALRRVVTDAGLRDRLITAGRSRASAFTWRRTAEATAAVYREALG